MTVVPHILERGESRELICQKDFRWIIYDETGYARIDPMPNYDDAVDIQLERGDGYVEGYRKKLKSKLRRSRKRAKYLKSKMKGPRVLDVGSNVGCYVAACHELGLDAQGIEISPTTVEEANRLFPECRFVHTSLEEFDDCGDKFDGIYCSEVIEHVPDPFGFAKRLCDLMNDQGAMYLTTPCIDEYTKDGKVNRNMGAPDHKLYFNKTNIKEFMIAAGFSKVKHKFSFGKGLQVLCIK